MVYILHFPQKLATTLISSTSPTFTETSWIPMGTTETFSCSSMWLKTGSSCNSWYRFSPWWLWRKSLRYRLFRWWSRLWTKYHRRRSTQEREHWQLHPKRWCGSSHLRWFQLLGQYYVEASGKRIEGPGSWATTPSTRPITVLSVTSRSIMKTSTKPTMDLKITKAVPSFLMTKTAGSGCLWKWK